MPFRWLDLWADAEGASSISCGAPHAHVVVDRPGAAQEADIKMYNYSYYSKPHNTIQEARPTIDNEELRKEAKMNYFKTFYLRCARNSLLVPA
jgi:hypothetical protein